ncbi:MAG TPA: LpqB family beta-propeller domain-containing protein [Gemmatimonadaceae bacterium]|nr:LpqB family beta-propeller domain-containing protein [Gemmatimonadaceae bacterium]
MSTIRLSLAAGALALALVPHAPSEPAVAPDLPAPKPSFAEPSLSPDGRELAFVSGGDVWSVPREGGVARLLVSHEADESRPLFSPDGTRLAFVSTRTGNGDLYVLVLATGELRRVTYDDGRDQLDGWSHDGKWLYYSSSSRDISGMQDVWRVSASGGTPMPVAADRYASEYWAAEAPDGRRIAITARGVVASQWWRNGHSHLDESEIWLVGNVAPGQEGAPAYSALTTGGAKSAWPMWSPDGGTVYFMSDRSGAENLWAMPASGGQARQLTRFTDGRVLWPSIGQDGRTIVFERDFGLWAVDVAGGEPRRIDVTLRGAPAGAAAEHLRLTNGLQELALSPDGKKVAFVVRGEVFAASSKDGGDAARVTESPALEDQLAWAPDSRRLVYASDREGHDELYLYDFTTRAETRLTSGDGDAVTPRWSPDGTRLAYVRGGRELRVLDVASKRDRVVARGGFDRPPFLSDRAYAWSPDGRWIAYSMPAGGKQFTNLFVVSAEGGESRPVSWLSNVFSGAVSWSPDGTYLLMSTTQRTEPAQLARVDLVPHAPRFREDQFRGLFEPEAPRPAQPQPSPDSAVRPDSSARVAARDSAAARRDSARRDATHRTEIVFEGIRERLSFVPTGLAVNAHAISPDGKQVVLTANVAGQTNLYVYPLDELADDDPVARQLTSTSGFKSDVQWSPDGKEVYFLSGGRIQAVKVEGGAPRTVAVTAEMDADFAAEKGEVFAQAWRYLRDNFYDERMHGVDWAAAREEWAPRIAGARTQPEMRRLLSLMIGELNASHMGVGGPAAQPPHTGRLGLRFDRAAYERDGRLRVTEVVPLGPAALAGGIGVGDLLTAVDGQPVDARTNLDALLAYRTGKRTELTIAPAAGGASRTVAVRPVSTGTAKGLLYRAWVESRRDYVAKASGGRLGYVHLYDMSQSSLDQLYLDLDAEAHEKEGVVVDVRNNNGGFVNAYALDVFTRRPYLTMQSRGFPQVPARTQLGQRALERPTVLVTNQHSLSDAEDFTEGYRALGLGKVVGAPTAGWIIYTSNTTLLDGTSLRLPFQRIRDARGNDMELHPRPVDVEVVRPVGESYTGRDRQLDAAVRVLLQTVAARKAEAGGG